MDPLTQGVLGASLPQASARGKYAASAGLLGFLAGMAADLDVLIRSSTDPLLFLEYHRQFTHSLVFIPVGGLLCGLVLHWLVGRRRGLSFRQSWLFCTLGYATHALLDACTTYGTMLFWPFSDVRIAWNTISIIDPLFTLPLLAGGDYGREATQAGVCARRFGLGGCAIWAGAVAAQRGGRYGARRWRRSVAMTPLRLEAKPSFANILVWKVVYETDDRFYVDAVRAECRTAGIRRGLGAKAGHGQGHALAGSGIHNRRGTSSAFGGSVTAISPATPFSPTASLIFATP